MDSTGRWYVASDVWHPTLFRSGVQCTAHRTTHTHRRPRRRRRRPPSLRLDCRSRRASPVTTPLALAAPAGHCTPRHHSRSSRSLPLTTVLWFPSVVDFPPPRHHPLDAALATHRPRREKLFVNVSLALSCKPSVWLRPCLVLLSNIILKCMCAAPGEESLSMCPIYGVWFRLILSPSLDSARRNTRPRTRGRTGHPARHAPSRYEP